MPNIPDPSLSSEPATAPILDKAAIKSCHIYLPDTPKPLSAIVYKGQFYSYVKVFRDLEAAQRAATRLVVKGNSVVWTSTSKGLILWVLEPDAYLASKPLGSQVK